MNESSSPQPEPLRRRDGTSRPLRPSRGWALFLDVDGTLLHLADTPEAVEVGEHLRGVLRALQPLLGGAIALISGRRIEDLDRLFAPLRLPAAGLHGLEHRGADGRTRMLGDPGMLDSLRRPLAEFAAGHEGVLLEDKGRALALHYRRAPDLAAACRRLVARLMARGGRGLSVIDGKMVLEIKPRLADKGEAVRGLLAEPPFAGRTPVFIGDDATDEDAFLAVNALDGYSVRVGDYPNSKARYRLADVDAVVAWLESLPRVLAGGDRP